MNIDIDPWEIRWQKSFHDELIRDDRQWYAAMEYVQRNAVRHGLVQTEEEWPWRSGQFTDVVDHRMTM